MADEPTQKPRTYGVILGAGSTGNLFVNPKIKGMDVGILENGSGNRYDGLEVTAANEKAADSDEG